MSGQSFDQPPTHEKDPQTPAPTHASTGGEKEEPCKGLGRVQPPSPIFAGWGILAEFRQSVWSLKENVRSVQEVNDMHKAAQSHQNKPDHI